MKKLIMFCVFAFPLVLLAQSQTSVQTGGTVSIVSPLISASLIASVLSIVVCANILLSGLQQFLVAINNAFIQLGKSEPGWLTTFSLYASKISGPLSKLAQWASANPQL